MKTEVNRTESCSARVADMLHLFDNHDPRLPYYSLRLERTLEDIPEYPLPAGYHFENYVPGDRETWISIEKSAKEFSTREEGEQAWQRYYNGHESELERRMFFAVNAAGRKVATATAYYDITNVDDGINGWLHWVAVCREEQGYHLAKPLITRVLSYMRSLGFRRAVIPTQTTTWLACKVYLDLGFRPIPENAVTSRKGWEIVKSLTHHPALDEFEEVDVLGYLKADTNV